MFQAVDNLVISGEEVMKLSEKKDFTGIFETFKLFNYEYKKKETGEMTFMKCVTSCLRLDNCNYFRHGNTTGGSINHLDVKDCTLWIPDP